MRTATRGLFHENKGKKLFRSRRLSDHCRADDHYDPYFRTDIFYGNRRFPLTRVICRTAVPFFFMVTGYFIVPKMKTNRKAVLPSLFKLSFLYGICILLYLPLNLYSGQFQGIGPGGLLKKIFFDGTFYHLWYFPAGNPQDWFWC